MLRSSLCLLFAAAMASTALAQTKREATDIVHHPFSEPFAGGGKLTLRVRSGDIQIIGTDEDRISVELSGRNSRDAGDLRVRFRRSAGEAQMRIAGGPRNGLTITVRIPSSTDLHARVPFGDLRVENMAGSQDIELHAGDLTVQVGDAAEYSHVDASVTAGDLDAVPFGETRDGLFRSFRMNGNGKHRLHAHVGAGDLVFVARPRALARR
ncbi:MAG: hypothetical protein ABI592_06500 [Acidobacteriota bacterium]